MREIVSMNGAFDLMVSTIDLFVCVDDKHRFSLHYSTVFQVLSMERTDWRPLISFFWGFGELLAMMPICLHLRQKPSRKYDSYFFFFKALKS